MKIKILLSLLLFFFLNQCSNQKKINIYMIGDSTMAEYDSTRFPLTGWGEVFHDFLNENATVYNYAESGKSTKSFRDLGYWQTVYDSLKKDDYLLIQFGHNDEKIKKPEHFAAAGGAYKQNLQRYIEEARGKGAIPILITSISRRAFDEQGNLINTHGSYPEEMRKLAKEINVPLVDLQKMTKILIEKYGVEDSKKLFLWFDGNVYDHYPKGKKDNTHLSEYGATEICKLAVDGIKKLDLNLKNYLINID